LSIKLQTYQDRWSYIDTLLSIGGRRNTLSD